MILVISGKAWQVFKYIKLLAKYQGKKTLEELAREAK